MVDPKTGMEYRYLGNSGVSVSRFAYGNWLSSGDEKDYKLTRDVIQRCFEHGVNFFDTAEAYGFGQAEATMGKAIKELGLKRENIVVSTKIFRAGPNVNDLLLSRKHIIEGTNNALKRLQMDYVDIIFCHRPDYNAPLEETCRAMSWLIE